MNLISFPVWTCGGLFCDILNKTLSPIDKNGGMGLPYHKSLLIVKGPETESNNLLQQKIDTVDLSQNIWVGTHTYPDKIDLDQFDKVIIVNLITPLSITYRYARILHQCIYGNGVNGNRKVWNPSLWKNPSHHKMIRHNVDNVDFEDVVDWKNSMVSFLEKHTKDIEQSFINNRKKTWIDLNSFLYDQKYIDQCYQNIFQKD